MTGMSAIFYPLLEVTSLKKHVCVKDSSAEGTCHCIKEETEVNNL